jgi:mannose-6-phosphate isomerase-like protein (cupin superfamily)
VPDESSGDFKTSAIEDLPQAWDGWAKLVRAGLGISAFGIQIMDYPADYTTKSHNELHSGQEEVYLALRGSGQVLIGSGEELPLDPDHVIRVGPEVDRTIRTGPEGVRVLCVGGAPGKPYRSPEWTEGTEES